MSLHVKESGAWRTVAQPRAKVAGTWRNASAVYTKVDGQWREVWPGGTGTPRIVGPRNGQYGHPIYPEGSGLIQSFGSTYPNVPYYQVVGDKSQIASAEVSMRWTPRSPKDPKEHTNSWRAPVGWGIYRVMWARDATENDSYYAAMTDAEVAAIVHPKYAIPMWTPRDGGYFAYMPACWDVSGVAVPMIEHDAHSGYAPFPPDRAASSSLTDYTVSDGYGDMSNPYWGEGTSYSSVTITLRNSGGAVLDTWTGPINFGFTHVPGADVGPESVKEIEALTFREEGPEWYWPEEWRSLFDTVSLRNSITISYVRDLQNGVAEWHVFDEGEPIGNFRLALHVGRPDVIEIHAVNLREDLIGEGIMHTIVDHGVRYCPTKYVVVRITDDPTYEAMLSWGWVPLERGSDVEKAAPWVQNFHVGRYLWNRSDPMYNRFSELKLAPPERVLR